MNNYMTTEQYFKSAKIKLLIMANLSELIKSISRKHGSVIDLNKNPEILMDIITELRINAPQEDSETIAKSPTPFGVPWLDSWAANWMLHQQPAKSRGS